MAPVVHRQAGADADADLGEIQPDPVGPAQAVKGDPLDLAQVHAAGPGMVADEGA